MLYILIRHGGGGRAVCPVSFLTSVEDAEVVDVTPLYRTTMPVTT